MLCAVAAGHGKSRIIPAVIYLLAQRRSKVHRNFVVVFSDYELMLSDKLVIDKLQAALPNVRIDCRVLSNSGVLRVKRDEVVMMDEADNLLLDKGMSITYE